MKDKNGFRASRPSSKHEKKALEVIDVLLYGGIGTTMFMYILNLLFTDISGYLYTLILTASTFIDKELSKTDPFKCRKCQKWTKYGNPKTKICHKCDKELNNSY